ncbi:MAG: hypothetical protein ACM3S5_05650 [Rhodospirillales bacterium]
MFTGMPHVSTDAGQKTLIVRGTAGQIAMAGWLVGELDVAAGSAQQSKDPFRLEYRVQNGSDDLVRVFNLKHITTSIDLQSTQMVLRVTTGITKLFNYGRRPTLVAGGTSEQIRAPEWLIAELDQPAGRQRDNLQTRFSASYPAPGDPQELVRVFYAADNATVRDLDEISITFRTIVGIIRIFALNSHKALVLRGTAGQLSLAEWLFTELASGARAPDPAQKSGLPASKEYWDPEPVGKLGELVRVFRFAPNTTARNVQEAARSVQHIGRIPTVFPCTGLRAVVVRGNAQEVALAEALIRERSFVPPDAVR